MGNIISSAFPSIVPTTEEQVKYGVGTTAAQVTAALLLGKHVILDADGQSSGVITMDSTILIPSNSHLTIAVGTTVKLANAKYTYLLRNYGTDGLTSSWLTGNTNIVIDGGGTLDFNFINNLASPGNIGASLDNWISMGLYFINCTNVVLRDLTIVGAPYTHTMKVNKYLCYFTGGGDIWCDNLVLNNTSDGLHFHGNQYDIKITNISGWTNDDMIGVTPSNGGYSNYTPIGITEGPLNGIYIDNVRQYGNGTATLLYGCDYLGVKYPIINAKVNKLYSKPVVTTYNNPTTITYTSGASFTLSYGGQETGAILSSATHTQIKTALEALSTIGSGNITFPSSGASVISLTPIVVTIGGVSGSLAGQVTTAITQGASSVGVVAITNDNTNTNPTFRFGGVWGMECTNTYGWIPRANSVLLGVFDGIEAPTSLPCRGIKIYNTTRRDQEALGSTLSGGTSTGRIFTTNTEFRAADLEFNGFLCLTNEGTEGLVHNNGSQAFNCSVIHTRSTVASSASRTFAFATSGSVQADGVYPTTITAGGASPGNFLTDGFVVGDVFVATGSATGTHNQTFTITGVTATVLTVTSPLAVVAGTDAATAVTFTYYAGYITNMKICNGRINAVHATFGTPSAGTSHLVYSGLGVGFDGFGSWTGVVDISNNTLKDLQYLAEATDNAVQTLNYHVHENTFRNVDRGVQFKHPGSVTFTGNFFGGTTSRIVELAAANASATVDVRFDATNHGMGLATMLYYSTAGGGSTWTYTLKSCWRPRGRGKLQVVDGNRYGAWDADVFRMTAGTVGQTLRLRQFAPGDVITVRNDNAGAGTIILSTVDDTGSAQSTPGTFTKADGTALGSNTIPANTTYVLQCQNERDWQIIG